MSPISKTDPETERIRKIQGERIKILLDITGKNAIDLHRYVGYSGDSMIYLILKGERFMSRAKIKKAAEFLVIGQEEPHGFKTKAL